MLNETINYYINVPVLELIAVIASLAYVVFAAKENIWCWPAAIISTVLYTVIFYDVYLWMDSLLQVYYLVMALFGWYSWRNGVAQSIEVSHTTSGNGQQRSTDNVVGVVIINRWAPLLHGKIIALLAIISLVIGHLMATYTPAHFPYLDAATTVYAVFATYLVTQKVLENWLYWIVIDFVSIYLYIEKGLVPTAGLFVVYTIIAVIGYLNWRKKIESTMPLAQV